MDSLLILLCPDDQCSQHFFVLVFWQLCGSSSLHYVLLCTSLAANHCCFTDQPVVQQSSPRQRKHNDGKPESPRERKNKGQYTHTHLQYVCGAKDAHTHLTCTDTRGKAQRVQASKNAQHNEPQKVMQTHPTHSLSISTVRNLTHPVAKFTIWIY